MLLKKLPLSLLLFFLSTLNLHADDNGALLNIYNGLEPTSITQHIALYKLYPDHPIGKKALLHAQELLQKAQLSTDHVEDLPIVGLSVEGFVSFMLGKETREEFLEPKFLDAIEQLGAHLGNRSLKGHHAQSEGEVIALEDDQIDLSRAVLLAQQGDKIDWNWIRNYEAQLDFLALQVLARLPENPTPKQMIKEINRVLFFDLKYRFPNQNIQDDHERFSQLSEVLDVHQGVCLGTSVVYLCLAQRLNFPLEIITPPGHIYVRHNDNGVITNIETTHRGVHVPSDHYYSVNMKYLKKISLKETVGLISSNLAASNLMERHYPQAIEHYQRCLNYAKDHPMATLMLGYAYALNKEPKNARRIFNHFKSLSFDDQIAPMDLNAHQDYLNNQIDLPLLEATIALTKESSLEALQADQKVLIQGLKKHPQFTMGWLVLSSIYNELSQPQKAIEALTQAHKINPNIPLVELNLALLHHSQLNTPAAWKHFRNCESILEEHQVHPKFMHQIEQMFSSTSMPPD